MLPFLRPDLNQFSSYTTSSLGDTEDKSEEGQSQKAVQYDQLDANECPYDMPAELKQKLAWQLEHEIRFNRYPAMDPEALKREIAAYVNESLGRASLLESELARGDSTDSTTGAASPFSPANISVGNGSDEILRSLMIATCLGGAGTVLIASPTFSMYQILAQSLGIGVVDAGRDPDTLEINLEAAQVLIDAQTQTPVRAVFVVHPNSPTANALTAAEIAWLKQLPSEILVVVDEAYFEFSGQTLAAEILTRPNWVVTRTFSKAFRLAAHRVGYSIASPEMTAVLEKLRLPYNLPSSSQAAAWIAMQNRQELLKVIPEILTERDRLHAALENLKPLKIYPSEANFCFAQLQPGIHSEPQQILGQILAHVKAQGTMIRHTGGGLRLSVGTPQENQRLLERLQNALAELL